MRSEYGRPAAAPRERRQVHSVVIGGGPAGSATALALLKRGCSVALVERGRYETAAVGETLPPEARRLLEALGVLKQFEAAGHLPSPGIVSLWGSPVPAAQDFLFNPYGQGWHLDRARFDGMLATIAGERGAFVHLGAAVSGRREPHSERWNLLVTDEAGVVEYDCDHVVDAAGRATLRFGPRRPRVVADELVAIIGIGPALRPTDARTLLEASEQGWWYCATLPGGRALATFMTDPRLLGPGYRTLFREQLRTTELVSAYLGEVEPASLRVHRCPSYLRTPITRDGWIAVGDAASTFDPLSSLGVCKALDSGMRAAEALMNGRLEAYEAWTQSSFDQYLATRAAFYGMERRWPGSPFWRSRQSG